MEDATESAVQRAERLKKSHDEHKKMNPEVYGKEGAKRPAHSSRLSSSGPGWAQTLVNSLGRLEVSVRLQELQLKLLVSRSLQRSLCGCVDGRPSVLGPGAAAQAEVDKGSASEYFENLAFDQEDLGGSYDDYD